MVTLRDVAKACGCSVTSASRALKNSPTISLELRKKARRAAADLGYIPNNVAKSMRTGRTNSIALIMQEAMNIFYSIVIHAVEQAAADNGFSLIMLTANYQPERELGAVHTSLSKKVDGVLLFPLQQDSKSVEALTKAKVPFVLAGRFFEGLKPDCVMADDQQGVYLTTRHLLERGHKHILMINSFKYISSSRLREKGYRQAMAEAGCKVREHDVHYISTQRGTCARLVRKIFGSKHDYTAICCYNDVLGYEAYYTLHQMGIDVPGQVAITGVDDLHSYFTFPVRLTSAGYDIAGMSRMGLELLVEKIEFFGRANVDTDGWQNRTVTLNQYLVEGEST